LLGEDLPQIYAACGRGPQSSLRILRNGVEVVQLAALELPANPNAVWTVKRRSDDPYDAYIVVSFVNATVVLSIGESVEEVTDSGFLLTTPTLAVTQLGEDSLLQVRAAPRPGPGPAPLWPRERRLMPSKRPATFFASPPVPGVPGGRAPHSRGPPRQRVEGAVGQADHPRCGEQPPGAPAVAGSAARAGGDDTPSG